METAITVLAIVDFLLILVLAQRIFALETQLQELAAVMVVTLERIQAAINETK